MENNTGKPMHPLIRVLLSAGIGFAVFALACVVSWLSFRDQPLASIEQYRTTINIWTLGKLVEEYKTKFGKWPDSLVEIATSYRLQEKQYHDGWGRPFLYSVDGDRPRILSLGRDGQPGGRGIDADMVADGHKVRREPLTFSQFMDSEFKKPSIYSGILVFLLSLYLLRSVPVKQQEAMPLSTKLILIAIAAIGTAVVMCLFYIASKSGH